MIEAKKHWESVYESKGATDVSWFQSHSTHSLSLIRRFAKRTEARIVDVGSGSSVLIDELLESGYTGILALDLAEKALDLTRRRLGDRAAQVQWVVADVTVVALPVASVSIWHDRAVFHFMTAIDARDRYVETLRRALEPGGVAIIATFAPDGPTHCSGLEVARYSAEGICAVLGDGFELIASEREIHRTPGGGEQRFVYACCRKV
jgi:ubiquinone/menaquinone biosynthesis C-methylase UbiE